MSSAKLFSRLTSSQDEQSNIRHMLSRGSFFTATITLVSVPVLQVFALENGIDETKLGIIRLIVQAGGVLGYLLFMQSANKISDKTLVRKNSLAHLANVVLPAVLLVLTLFSTQLSPTAFLIIYTLGWALSTFLISKLSVVLSRVESKLFASPIFGKAYGISGIVYYLLSMALGAGIKIVLSWGKEGFFPIFGAALVFALASAYAAKGFRIVKTDPPLFASSQKNKSANSKKTQKALIIIILMHVLRGAMSGITFFFVPVALKNFGLFPSDAGTASLLFSAGYLAGYLLIFRAFDRIGAAHTIFFGSVLEILPFLILIFAPNRMGFFAFYFIFCLGDVLIAQGVPLGIFQTIPSTSIGTITALRLVAMQLADALTAFGIGPVIVERFPLFAGLYCILALLVTVFGYLSLSTEKRI